MTLLRLRNGLTQGDLAARAGVHLSTVRRLEHYPGTCQTTWQTVKKLADVLDVHPLKLLLREVPKIYHGADHADEGARREPGTPAPDSRPVATDPIDHLCGPCIRGAPSRVASPSSGSRS